MAATSGHPHDEILAGIMRRLLHQERCTFYPDGSMLWVEDCVDITPEERAVLQQEIYG